MREMLVFEVRINRFITDIERPVNLKNIIDYDKFRKFLSNKTDKEVSNMYCNEIYLGLQSIEIGVKSAIWDDTCFARVQIYEENLISLIGACEAESIIDETYKYAVKDMFDMYECGSYEKVEVKYYLDDVK